MSASPNGPWARIQLGLVLVMLVAANLSIAVSQLSLGLALLVHLYRLLVRREPAAATGLGRWTLALAAWAALMIPFSTDPQQSLVFYKRFFLFAGLWVTAAVAFDGKRQGWLLVAVLAGALAASVWGMVHVWQQTGSLFKMRLGQMSNPMTSGCLLMMSLLLAGGFLLAVRRRTRTFWWLAAVSVPLAVALLQTMTRSAWLGVGAGVLVMLLLARPRLAGLFLAAVVAVILLAPRLPEDVVAPHMKKRLDPTYIFRGNSSQQRAYMWQRGWAMVHEHPVTGVGDRDLRAIGPDYFHRPDMDEHGHLHSNPVMLAAIWGVPGFVLGMGFLLLQLKLLIGRWRSLGRPRQGVPAGWILAGLGVWSGFFVAGLTEWYFGDAESMLLYLAITGVALGFPLARPEHGEHHV